MPEEPPAAKAPAPASRRSFLKAFSLGATGALAPGAAGPPARAVAPVVVLPEARLAGAEHLLGVEERLALEAGARLGFRRDPGNPHDAGAVAVELLGEGEPRRLGFVHRGENEVIRDLLDAGHEVAGELLPSERFTLHNRLKAGAAPDARMRFLKEVSREADGARLVRLEAVRPRFRARIATGHVAAAKPPDPDEVPGEPGWRRVVPAHQARRLNWAAHFDDPPAWAAGMELALREDPGAPPGWGMFSLLTAQGRHLGTLEGPHQTAVHRALGERREVRVVVVGVGQQRWSGRASTPAPIIEVRASKALRVGRAAPEEPTVLEAAGAPPPGVSSPPIEPGGKAPPGEGATHEPRSVTDAAAPSPGRHPPLGWPTEARLFRASGDGLTEAPATDGGLDAPLRGLLRGRAEALLGLRPRDEEPGEGFDALVEDAGGARVLLALAPGRAVPPTADGFVAASLRALDRLLAARPDLRGARLLCVAAAFDAPDLAAARADARVGLVRCRRHGGDLVLVERLTGGGAPVAGGLAAYNPSNSALEM